MWGYARRGRHLPRWCDTHLGTLDSMTAIGPRGFNDRRQTNTDERFMSVASLACPLAPARVVRQLQHAVEPPGIITRIVGDAGGGRIREGIGGEQIVSAHRCRVEVEVMG